MTLFWVFASAVLAILWIVTIVDVFRRHYPRAKVAAWLCLIVLVPYAGAILYWILRKPTTTEVEQAYLADADTRAHR